MTQDEKQYRRKHRSLWCWLFGCSLTSANGDFRCVVCGRYRYFEIGKPWNANRRRKAYNKMWQGVPNLIAVRVRPKKQVGQ